MTKLQRLEMPPALYKVQIKYKGEWIPGESFYGFDIVTGSSFGNYSGSLSRAVELAQKEQKRRKPGTVRILRYVHPQVVHFEMPAEEELLEGAPAKPPKAQGELF